MDHPRDDQPALFHPGGSRTNSLWGCGVIYVGPISSLLESMWDPCENGMDPLTPQGDDQGSSFILVELHMGSPRIHVVSISSLLESM